MESLLDAIAELKSDFHSLRMDFSFEFITLVGKKIGVIPEWETRLAVQGSGLSSLFRRRGPGDSFERPPGRFTGQLTDAALLSFVDVLEQSGIASFRSEVPNPRDPVHILRVLVSGRLFTFTWGSLRPPVPEPMLRLKRLLAEWSLNACPNPIWSLSMRVFGLKYVSGKLNARLRIENTGTEGIRMADPGSDAIGPDFTLFLKYGEKQLIEEGFTPAPVEIHLAPYPKIPTESTRFILISPAVPWELEFSAELEGQAPRGWIGKFAFLHYLPSDVLAGVPVFSGALYTEEFAW
jgi:hypothetical protein